MMKPKGKKADDEEMLEYVEEIVGTNQYKTPIAQLAVLVEDLAKEEELQVRTTTVSQRQSYEMICSCFFLSNLTFYYRFVSSEFESPRIRQADEHHRSSEKWDGELPPHGEWCFHSTACHPTSPSVSGFHIHKTPEKIQFSLQNFRFFFRKFFIFYKKKFSFFQKFSCLISFEFFQKNLMD